jgi:hypothetical protein
MHEPTGGKRGTVGPQDLHLLQINLFALNKPLLEINLPTAQPTTHHPGWVEVFALVIS